MARRLVPRNPLANCINWLQVHPTRVRRMECLGLRWLAECVYNPKVPTTAYFTIGDGVAALSLLLLIHAICGTLYEFRLSVRRIRSSWLYIAANTSFITVLIASATAIRWGHPNRMAGILGDACWPGFLFCYFVLAASLLDRTCR
jgi:hypothetical protein